MKSVNLFVLVLMASLGLSACASDGGLRDAEKLELYRAHAGEPVGSFNFFGRLNGWAPLGDGALAVWTKPNEGWLLELTGPCPDLGFTQTIGLTSNMNRVYARFDKVLVRSTGSINVPCHIQTIRPLNVKAIKASEQELREARIEAREAGATE